MEPPPPPTSKRFRIRVQICAPQDAYNLSAPPLQQFTIVKTPVLPLPELSLQQLCEEVVKRFRAIYPGQSLFAIERSQDSYGSDLYFGDRVRDIFEDNEVFRVIKGATARESVKPHRARSMSLQPGALSENGFITGGNRRLGPAASEDLPRPNKRQKLSAHDPDRPLRSSEVDLVHEIDQQPRLESFQKPTSFESAMANSQETTIPESECEDNNPAIQVSSSEPRNGPTKIFTGQNNRASGPLSSNSVVSSGAQLQRIVSAPSIGSSSRDEEVDSDSDAQAPRSRASVASRRKPPHVEHTEDPQHRVTSVSTIQTTPPSATSFSNVYTPTTDADAKRLKRPNSSSSTNSKNLKIYKRPPRADVYDQIETDQERSSLQRISRTAPSANGDLAALSGISAAKFHRSKARSESQSSTGRKDVEKREQKKQDSEEQQKRNQAAELLVAEAAEKTRLAKEEELRKLRQNQLANDRIALEKRRLEKAAAQKAEAEAKRRRGIEVQAPSERETEAKANAKKIEEARAAAEAKRKKETETQAKIPRELEENAKAQRDTELKAELKANQEAQAEARKEKERMQRLAKEKETIMRRTEEDARKVRELTLKLQENEERLEKDKKTLQENEQKLQEGKQKLNDIIASSQGSNRSTPRDDMLSRAVATYERDQSAKASSEPDLEAQQPVKLPSKGTTSTPFVPRGRPFNHLSTAQLSSQAVASSSQEVSSLNVGIDAQMPLPTLKRTVSFASKPLPPVSGRRSSSVTSMKQTTLVPPRPVLADVKSTPQRPVQRTAASGLTSSIANKGKAKIVESPGKLPSSPPIVISSDEGSSVESDGDNYDCEYEYNDFVGLGEPGPAYPKSGRRSPINPVVSEADQIRPRSPIAAANSMPDSGQVVLTNMPSTQSPKHAEAFVTSSVQAGSPLHEDGFVKSPKKQELHVEDAADPVTTASQSMRPGPGFSNETYSSPQFGTKKVSPTGHATQAQQDLLHVPNKPILDSERSIEIGRAEKPDSLEDDVDSEDNGEFVSDVSNGKEPEGDDSKSHESEDSRSSEAASEDIEKDLEDNTRGYLSVLNTTNLESSTAEEEHHGSSIDTQAQLDNQLTAQSQIARATITQKSPSVAMEQRVPQSSWVKADLASTISSQWPSLKQMTAEAKRTKEAHTAVNQEKMLAKARQVKEEARKNHLSSEEDSSCESSYGSSETDSEEDESAEELENKRIRQELFDTIGDFGISTTSMAASQTRQKPPPKLINNFKKSSKDDFGKLANTFKKRNVKY